MNRLRFSINEDVIWSVDRKKHVIIGIDYGSDHPYHIQIEGDDIYCQEKNLKPVFNIGDKVKWKNEEGNKLHGTIRDSVWFGGTQFWHVACDNITYNCVEELLSHDKGDETGLDAEDIIRELKHSERYGDFTFLYNAVKFEHCFKDKEYPLVQLYDMTPVSEDEINIVGFAGSFQWENGRIVPLDGDIYDDVTIWGYKEFKTEDGNTYLNILASKW